MALIRFNSTPDSEGNVNCLPGVQRYLAYLEGTVKGKPGMPVANPEPHWEPPEAAELIDGDAVEPEPKAPKRKRKPVRKADMPARDSDAVNLAKYARKLKGEP